MGKSATESTRLTRPEAAKLRRAIASGDVAVETYVYEATQRTAWEKGDRSIVNARTSKVPPYIRDVLLAKAEQRPKRFFGEALVASRTGMKDGWYSSYKWLTADKWVTSAGLKEGFEVKFYEALDKHLGLPLVERIQSMVRATDKKLVAPDLWMILRDGTHRFVEVKLEKDRLSHEQTYGLKVIQHALTEAGLPVHVAIANVVQKGLRAIVVVEPSGGRYPVNEVIVETEAGEILDWLDTARGACPIEPDRSTMEDLLARRDRVETSAVPIMVASVKVAAKLLGKPYRGPAGWNENQNGDGP